MDAWVGPNFNLGLRACLANYCSQNSIFPTPRLDAGREHNIRNPKSDALLPLIGAGQERSSWHKAVSCKPCRPHMHGNVPRKKMQVRWRMASNAPLTRLGFDDDDDDDDDAASFHRRCLVMKKSDGQGRTREKGYHKKSR